MLNRGVSVVLPTFNEATNICELIDAVISNLPEEIDYEILIMDDDSQDNTFNIVKNRFGSNDSVKPFLRTENKGFAASIKDGVLNSVYDKIIIMDSDFTHDPSEFSKLLQLLSHYDLISCSRFASGGGMHDTANYLVSFFYNLFLRLILKTQIQDNTGGYFATHTKLLKKYANDNIFYGYGDYYFRVLSCYLKDGLSVLEIPSIYQLRNSGLSKSSWMKMIIRYTLSAIKLRYVKHQ